MSAVKYIYIYIYIYIINISIERERERKTCRKIISVLTLLGGFWCGRVLRIQRGGPPMRLVWKAVCKRKKYTLSTSLSDDNIWLWLTFLHQLRFWWGVGGWRAVGGLIGVQGIHVNILRQVPGRGRLGCWEAGAFLRYFHSGDSGWGERTAECGQCGETLLWVSRMCHTISRFSEQGYIVWGLSPVFR